MVLTNKDLKPRHRNTSPHKLKVKHFEFVNVLCLGYITDITYYDSKTKITHTIR